MRSLFLLPILLQSTIQATFPLDQLPIVNIKPSLNGEGDGAQQYDGQSVVRCVINDEQVMNRFQSIVVDEMQMDLWTDRFQLGLPIDVRTRTLTEFEFLIPPSTSPSTAANSDFGCRPWIQDLALAIEQHSRDNLESSLKNNEGGDFYASFHSYDELVQHVTQLAEKYPKAVKKVVSSIGKTWEGRDIMVLHLTSPSPSPDGKPKKVIWFDGGIHAREWISSHVSVFLIEQLITGYGKVDAVTNLLDNLEFVVSPHINPDGYEHSRLHDRMWRKNRRKNPGNSYGVDLNRNFDIKWGQGGSSRYPASDTYMGPSSASEPEVQALQKYIGSLDRAVVGINFHSYSQLILRPYGHSFDTHPTEQLNKELGDGMRDIIKKFSKVSYTSERSADLYPVTGGMDDWMTDQGMIGFTIELRDTGRYGFLLPPRLIRPTCEEIWEAVQFMGEFVREKVPIRS